MYYALTMSYVLCPYHVLCIMPLPCLMYYALYHVLCIMPLPCLMYYALTMSYVLCPYHVLCIMLLPCLMYYALTMSCVRSSSSSVNCLLIWSSASCVSMWMSFLSSRRKLNMSSRLRLVGDTGGLYWLHIDSIIWVSDSSSF